ncbi:MAG: serine/threonine-protein kinase [Planctomycetota bacterium]
MPEPTLPLDQLAAIDAACDRFESAWLDAGVAGDGPRCEEFAEHLPDDLRGNALRELFAIERQYRGKRGEDPTAWAAERPVLSALASASRDDLETLPEPTTLPRNTNAGLRARCPRCQQSVTLGIETSLEEIVCDQCGATFGLTMSDTEGPAESLRIGRFLLRERLGMGAFGVVWRARDPELDRDVALKSPRAGQLTPRETEMFFREARAAAQLAHPGIVSVHEVGRDDGVDGSGAIYLVSELVDGQPLSDKLKGWRPTPRETAALVADIAEALAYAHGRGVVHRDLKPSNIMLDPFSEGGTTASMGPADLGRPRLMDFGLAKRAEGEVTMTLDGQVMGTPAYMSPEQASGQVRWVDRRTDIYAIGVVLFRLLTGELPYRGTAQSQIQQRIVDDAPSPRRLDESVPIDLATVCLKCMERAPNARYSNAQEVAAEMRRFLAGEPVEARPLSPWGRAGRWAKRRPASATALALGAMLAIGGPIAAIIIAQQAGEVRNRLNEIVAQEARQAKEIDQREAEKDAIRDSGPRLLPVEAVPGWRRELIERLLNQDGDRLVAAATAEPAASLPGQSARIAVARLLLAIGRADDAAALLADLGAETTNQPSLDALRKALQRAEATQQHAGAKKTQSGTAGRLMIQSLPELSVSDQLPEGELTPELLTELANALLQHSRPPPTDGSE